MSVSSKRAIATTIVGFVLPIALLFSMNACARSSEGPAERKALSYEAAKQFQPKKMNAVAVLPFEDGPENVLGKELSARLTQRLVAALEVGTSLEILNTTEPQRLKTAAQEVETLAAPLQTKATMFGSKLTAQGVLYGVVQKYDAQTEGTSLGSYNPSGASFTLWLVDPEAKQVLWTATYERTQQPLSDNLLNVPQALNQGVGFRTSEQLIESGFQQAAEALESLRSQAQ